MSMNDVKSLSHSIWRCKYYIVFDQCIKGKKFMGSLTAKVAS